MFKKMICTIAVTSLLAGCGDGSFSNAVDEGRKALENGDITGAIDSFQNALTDNAAVDSLQQFSDLQTAVENGDWQQVLSLGDALANNAALQDVQGQIETYMQQATEALTNGEAFQNALNDIEQLIQSNNVEEAKQQLEQLIQLREANEILSSFDAQLQQIQDTITNAGQ